MPQSTTTAARSRRSSCSHVAPASESSLPLNHSCCWVSRTRESAQSSVDADLFFVHPSQPDTTGPSAPWSSSPSQPSRGFLCSKANSSATCSSSRASILARTGAFTSFGAFFTGADSRSLCWPFQTGLYPTTSPLAHSTAAYSTATSCTTRSSCCHWTGKMISRSRSARRSRPSWTISRDCARCGRDTERCDDPFPVPSLRFPLPPSLQVFLSRLCLLYLRNSSL